MRKELLGCAGNDDGVFSFPDAGLRKRVLNVAVLYSSQDAVSDCLYALKRRQGCVLTMTEMASISTSLRMSPMSLDGSLRMYNLKAREPVRRAAIDALVRSADVVTMGRVCSSLKRSVPFAAAS